jgi:hypothetical protein
MTFNQCLSEEGLVPLVQGLGLLDASRRDELMSRAPANDFEARLQAALSESLCLFEQFGDLLIWFAFPSRSFFIESITTCEITSTPRGPSRTHRLTKGPA